jgi:hypothetical protein
LFVKKVCQNSFSYLSCVERKRERDKIHVCSGRQLGEQLNLRWGGGEKGGSTTAALNRERESSTGKNIYKKKGTAAFLSSLSGGIRSLSLSLLSFRVYGGTTQTSEDIGKRREPTDEGLWSLVGSLSLVFGYNMFQRFFFYFKNWLEAKYRGRLLLL